MKNILVCLFLVAGFFIFSAKAIAQDEFEMKEGDQTYIMKKYYMVFLKKGDVRTQDSSTAAQIQKGHMEHINKLAKEGYLHIAGPFGGDGDLRGILVLSVKSKEEAEKIASEDPAVVYGRLKVEVLEWWAAKGSTLK